MSQKHRVAATSWKGFLPEDSWIMVPSPIADGADVNLGSTQVFDSIDKFNEDLLTKEPSGCQLCGLCETRKNIVVGEGSPSADLVFVGEGPGATEDETGRPFVGKAGQLLDKMVQAMGLSRDQVFICNVVKCRPPGNRDPLEDEINACESYLFRQLDVIQPKVIVALGKFAAQTLLKTDQRISQLRGKFFSYRGTQLIPTFHPSFLLRNPSAKKEVWEDLQKVAVELGIEIPKRGRR